MEAPFTSATFPDPETPTKLNMVVTPTCLASEPSALYPYLVECMDGQEANPAVDLRKPSQLRAMVRQHFWSQKRVEFVLGHELSHILNGDLEPKGSVKSMFSSMMGLEKQELRKQEFLADSRAAEASPGLALGGLDHLVRQDDFLWYIDSEMTAKGFGDYVVKMQEERHKTHPTFISRIQAILTILDKKHNISPKEAFTKTFYGEDYLDETRLASGHIAHLEKELDLSPDCVAVLKGGRNADSGTFVKGALGNQRVKMFTPRTQSSAKNKKKN